MFAQQISNFGMASAQRLIERRLAADIAGLDLHPPREEERHDLEVPGLRRSRSSCRSGAGSVESGAVVLLVIRHLAHRMIPLCADLGLNRPDEFAPVDDR